MQLPQVQNYGPDFETHTAEPMDFLLELTQEGMSKLAYWYLHALWSNRLAPARQVTSPLLWVVTFRIISSQNAGRSEKVCVCTCVSTQISTYVSIYIHIHLCGRKKGKKEETLSEQAIFKIKTHS